MQPSAPNHKALQHRLLTPGEVAAMLQIKEDTLAKWRIIGCGPKWMRLPSSRTIRYRQTEIDLWLSNCTFQSTREADDADLISDTR